jgi:hypothetical protein
MTKIEKQSWERIRAMGRDRFIVREGLLRHGVPFGVLVALIQIFPFFRPSSEPFIALVASWAFSGVAFGAVMGLREWQTRERNYQKPTDDDVP